MNKKKKFLNYIESSEYVSCENVEKNENGDWLLWVVYHDNATYEITQFVCEQAAEYDFYVSGIIWDGGSVFKQEQNNSLFSL